MTGRELQTLALVAEGKRYGVIAEHLPRGLSMTLRQPRLIGGRRPIHGFS